MWKIPQAERRVYKRNPLDSVVAQLKFRPILKVNEVAPFQEQVRVKTGFVGYQSRASVDVQIVPGQSVANVVPSPHPIEHCFLTVDGSATLTLTPEEMTLRYTRYESLARVLSDMKASVGALGAVYGPVSPTRLGLRYVNTVDLAKVSRSTDPKAWVDVITTEFFRPPLKYVDAVGTSFYTQVSSPVETGTLTLGFGLIPDSTGSPPSKFRMDLDRSLQFQFQLKDVETLVTSFARDIFSLFDKACGPKLRDWMEK